MRIVLGAAFLSVLIVALYSFLPGNIFTGYKNDGLDMVNTVLTTVITLGIILATLLYGRNNPRLIYAVVAHPRKSFVRQTIANAQDVEYAKVLILSAIKESDFSEPSPGRALGNAVADIETARRVSGKMSIWPWDLAKAMILMQHVSETLKDSPMARFFIPEHSKAISGLLAQMFATALPLTSSEAVQLQEFRKSAQSDGKGDSSNSKDEEVPTSLFHEFVTEFTGSIVLVDAVHTRAKFARQVSVFHKGFYRGGTSVLQEDRLHTKSYEEMHVGVPAEEGCQWRLAFRNQPKTKADDFDGQVIEILGAAVTRRPDQSGVELMIVTGESCYAATEVAQVPGTQQENPLRSKGLRSAQVDEFAPVWAFSTQVATVKKLNPREGRVSLGVVSICLIQEPEDSLSEADRHVVLLQRPPAAEVRNGGEVIAPPGGVIAINAGSAESDIDRNGVPDPTLAAQKELEEETGISLPRSSFVPISVSIANDASPSGSAQLVATIGFTATIQASDRELLALRSQASAHAGKYESLGYVKVALPSEAALAQSNADQRQALAEKFALDWLELSNSLDQRSIVNALYLSASTFGISQTVEAFSKVWPSSWHTMAWAGLEAESQPLGRLARPIDLLKTVESPS